VRLCRVTIRLDGPTVSPSAIPHGSDPGAFVISYRCKIIDIKITASVKDNSLPMQTRGPPPKGMNVFCGRAATFSSRKLSGLY